MTNAAEQAYSSVCDILAGRILALIPERPEILDIESPFKLFKVDGFKCDDLLEKCNVCSEMSVRWFAHYITPTQRRCLALPARPDGTIPAVAMPDVIKLHCPVEKLYE